MFRRIAQRLWQRPVLSKILMGTTAAAGLALLIVFKMLLASNEARGALSAQVREAGHVNDRQALVVDALELNRQETLVALEAERLKAKAAVDALVASQEGLLSAKGEFEDRLEAARMELSDEELVCALQPVPDSYIDSLRQ